MMNCSMPTLFSLLFFIFFLSIPSFTISFSIRKNIIFCPEIEKQSLLSFKNSLKDPYKLLSSWDAEVNCCDWNRVICSNFTGHVHQLHLQANYYDSSFDQLSGKINPSLLNLKHLTYLNLSHNLFDGETIPSFMGLLSNLEHLDLSEAGFEGKIPHNIGNLSNLRTLHLEVNNVLEVDSLEWLFGLSKLEYLNMDQTNMSRATDWAKVINSLPSLLELHLSQCNLDFSHPPNNVNISTSLTFLDLSENGAYHDKFHQSFIVPVPVPLWCFQLRNLIFLDLSYNNFGGPIPTISNATKIQHINLNDNDFSNSSIPDWLYVCRNLEFVSLSSCSLEGKISDAVANLTSLKTLDLSYNSLSGSIPISLGYLLSLKELYLDGNKFTGNLPESLGQLYNLAALYIDNNKLEGIVTEIHFSNLSKLLSFHASGNRLTLNVGPNWVPPIQLEDLALGSWSFGVDSEIPSWLRMQRNITQLDLSNTGISGNTPRWFFNTWYLNVSHNNLHGTIPQIIGTSENQYLCMRSNKLSGSLPTIGARVNLLDLSHNLFSEGISDLLCNTTNEEYRLRFLLLEGNQLSGELPDCWNNFPALTHLKLGNNTMYGSIPHSIGFLARLESLSLHSNKFSGQMPFTMHNCTNLWKIHLSHNNLNGKLPSWIGTTLVNLEILILHSNKLSGEIPSEICHLQSLKIFDLANNQFSGIIPRCVSNFTAMATKRRLQFKDDHNYIGYAERYSGKGFYLETISESASIWTKGVELQYSTTLSLVTFLDLSMNNLSGDIPKEVTSLVELRSLNLSGNHLTGSIPESIGDMKQLESLDLSNNSLLDQIPNGLSLISSLSHLNVSFNKLIGRIPEGTQLGTLEASSFIGNDLCGPPLTRKCSHDGDEVHPKKEKNEGEKAEIEWLYVFISLGFAVGFSSVCTALVLNKSWRHAYFRLLDCMWDNLCMYFYIKWKRLTKPTASTSPT
ncbi:hypothetical protein C2S53_005723 [Perilla frutescens var. hirtella]|uniref:Leucine-rich repeat-containing N-terminal plant-type domain-containing protein n=1 Tax=Perilla frutescens var. hirtella TaxID=608512 RepID=A0AAD4JHA8_PERFH|nr:hypothetical protein C2S53_005723 [Perilla frutescens var. hirtella]